MSQSWNPSFKIGTLTGNYNYAYNQTPDQIVDIFPPATSPSGLNYQWEQCATPAGVFAAIPGATQINYTFSGPLTQTTYFRKKVYNNVSSVNSNVIKITVVSVNWEDLNYVREHHILTNNITDWQTIDQLPIGQKLQTTSYLDGLGRPVEKIFRETATPSQNANLWGDMVQFVQYDALGREQTKYLPYTSANQSGKYKTDLLSNQAQYYTNVYNETSAFSTVSFDNSPLNRVLNVKEPGAAWAAAAGKSAVYEVNTDEDNIRLFTVDYTNTSVPVTNTVYPANSLYKQTYTDENGKKVIEFADKSGRLILKKIQIDDNLSAAHIGWICTYSIYDDFGRLRFMLQPEAVKYLDAHSWSFAGADGQQVLAELCFSYQYDDKGRTIYKKVPGAKELRMLYDDRDRVVFMQDGNQRAKTTPEWTVNLYDELDRLTVTSLYKTVKTTTQLQTDITNSVVNSVTIVNPPQPISDLVVSKRDPLIGRYTAQGSITFVADGSGNFTTGNTDEFVAEISSNAVAAALTVTTTKLQSPINETELNNASVSTILKYLFYDNYNFNKVSSFNSAFENSVAYAFNDGNVLSITPSARTLSMPTGSLVRVLGTGTFLASTQYYDEKGRPIQSIEENIKSGKDITTLQYHFDGRLLSTHTRHENTGSDFNNYTILTKHIFDKIGRVISVQKKYGSNDFITTANYDFDDMGRLKTKHLAPGYTGTGGTELESLNYSYNIHSQITGINKDYALKTPGLYDKWSHYFGLYLGYDNKDGTFAKAELNGQVTGQLWNTMGDDAQRRYDYVYDNAGRLTNANFTEKQKTGDNWNTDKMNISVTGYNGKIEYDLNGNIQAMLHKGVMPGSSTAVTVDDLRYTYASYSNKLLKVTDYSTLGNLNGILGDFKDGNNGNADDYVYDDNGNLIIDLNKNVGTQACVAGITYNYLDKPEQITIAGKGQIKIVYDADGSKLQRMYIPEAADKTDATVTTYIDQFLYQETIPKTLATSAWTKPGGAVQYLNFEEGRVRVIQPLAQNNGFEAIQIAGTMNLPNGKQGSIDYFVRDYQSNVRMILTDETHFSSGTATMETGRANAEEPVFGQTGGANEVSQTRFPVNQIPGQTAGSGWQNSNIGDYVSKLGNLAPGKVGPNSLLKVMAGDQISATTQYYYQAPIGNTGSSNILSNVLNSLLAVLNTSSPNIIHTHLLDINNQLSQDPSFGNIVQPQEGSVGNIPKAYLSVLFFDERFNFIGESSNQLRVTDADNSNANLTLLNLKAPKNGYAYIYVSNSSDVNVYFDNLKVAHNRGRIVEENHYYAFGLKIAGISSKKLADQTGNEGHTQNEFGYNDKELFDDGDLNWYDYGFRNYDPQIGRFLQIDPLSDDYDALTPYHYAANDPIGNSDEDGLGVISDVGMVACAGTHSSFVMGMISTLASLGETTVGKVFTLINIAGNTTKIVNNATSNSKVNGQIKTEGVGQKSLDGQKGVSHEDFEKRGRESAKFEYEKLIGRSWHSAGGNKQVNDITGQVRYTKTALGDDLVGQAFGFYAMGKVPLPKFGLMAKIEGWLGIEATESFIPWEKISGIIRAALKGKGNFGLGNATYEEAMTAGKAWVGDGYRISSDGKAWVSSDELRIFRPPTYKPKLKMTQANFEWKTKVGGQPQGNGHLDIFKP